MQLVKIRITDSKKEAEGFVALAKRGRVVCFKDDTYVLAKSNLKVLDKLGIAYKVLAKEKSGYVGSLRNPLAA